MLSPKKCDIFCQVPLLFSKKKLLLLLKLKLKEGFFTSFFRSVFLGWQTVLAQFFPKCRKMGENQNWKMAWKMENLFSWWIFWLDGALRQIPMVVINHSDYSVIFITNWSPLMFLTDDKFLGSKSFTALKICVQKKLRWDQLSSENWPFHQWTLSADNKEKVKYERGSHLEILQRSSISLPTC